MKGLARLLLTSTFVQSRCLAPSRQQQEQEGKKEKEKKKKRGPW